MTSTSDEDGINTPQELLIEFWEKRIAKKPCKIMNIFPSSLYANLLPPYRKPGPCKGKNAAESYQVAADECRARIECIVQECQRTNEKFTDAEFNIEHGLNCLGGLMYWYNDQPPKGASVTLRQLSSALATLAESDLLVSPQLEINIGAVSEILDFENSSDGEWPRSAHRIDWIFENPTFTIDGFSSSDVQQGANGDCWFIAAVATICSNPDLMNDICVGKNEECGVYGFVFYRDGDWIWTVVDDNLW